jgi:hypothetical protein
MFNKMYLSVNSELLLDEDVQKALESLTQTKRLSEALLINFRAEV